MRAVALLSGGLDSTLAIRVVQDQGIEVLALNFTSLFCNCTPKTHTCSAAAGACRQLGVPLKAVNTTDDILQIVRAPRHGYGRHLNPCLDCRILKFRKAHDYMKETGASFLITGEVLGQRPMSQRRDAMALIEREAGVKGLVVRPLSAAVMPESIPEREGWIDRGKLLAITGRSRKPQIELARAYGIVDYPCPAGGCLLTDPGFSRRMRDLMDHTPNFTAHDALLLKSGRHFRLSPDAKAIVGRDEADNKRLQSLRQEIDWELEAQDAVGPLALVRGAPSDDGLALAARLVARYGKEHDRDTVAVCVRHDGNEDVLNVAPADDAIIEALIVGK